MHSATYYSDWNLLFVSCTGDIRLTSLTARVAEWIIAINAPKDRLVLVDMRRVHQIDRPHEGAEEFVNMQRKLGRKYPAARKLALVADVPEIFLMARIFEQSVQEHVPTEIEVFRDGGEALAFLGLGEGDLDACIGSLSGGRSLD